MGPYKKSSRRSLGHCIAEHQPHADSPNTVQYKSDIMNGHTYHTVPRVAIVTGASKGIGRDIALRLADDGLYVTINSRNAEELQVVAREIEAKGRKVLPYVGDVSEEEVVRDMVEKTVAVLGRLDVVSKPLTAPF